MENLMSVEFRVLRGSPLVGMKIDEIQKKFGVKIEHIHNPIMALTNTKVPDPEDKLNAFEYIEVIGPAKAVEELCREAVNY